MSGSSSRQTENTEDVPPPPPNKKYFINVEMDGAKGKDEKKWSSRCGVLIHGYIPISYDDWRNVDVFYKDTLWKAILKEFDMDIDPDMARPILDIGFSQYFRSAKSKLRNKYLKKDNERVPRLIAIENRPDDIDKVQWERFVDMEYDDRKRKQCKQNSENKGKVTINHTLGRKPYKRLYDELKSENPECEPTRTLVWKIAHTSKKTGEVLPCAAEKYALVEAAEARQKLEGGGGTQGLDSFEKDPIAEFFGDDKRRSYCRAISSTCNVKQVKLAQAAKAITASKENATKQQLANLENNQNQMHEDIKSMNSALAYLQQSMKLLINQHGGNMTPREEVASDGGNSNLHTTSNNAIGSSTRDKQSVVLLSSTLKEVAKGYVGVQKFCHHRAVLEGEKAIWVEEVLDPNALIFDAPHNGMYTLSDLVDGGFVIWSVNRLRFV